MWGEKPGGRAEATGAAPETRLVMPWSFSEEAHSSRGCLVSSNTLMLCEIIHYGSGLR